MAQTTFTVRMDADTKREFNALCSNIGLTMSTAFSIFAKKSVSEQRIPFELTANEPPRHEPIPNETEEPTDE